ncbi:TMEM175 family protein [Streptomyces sp. NPDC002285]|uniref:TMEM175 family protein n=1 Tax=unclassified Streptomyces TaxID=2593676 RepID=UPI003686146D
MWKSNPEGGPERLVALADGVFAIAITLLVLDINVPRELTERQYHDALRDLVPDFGAYALSVVVLGSFWRDHRNIFRTVRVIDGQIITLSVFGLGIAALLPFPTRLISEYGRDPVSVAIYAASVAALGAAHLALVAVLARRPWLRGDVTPVGGFGLYALDLAVTVTVFLLTIPLTLVAGAAAVWWWLVLVPLKVSLGLRARPRADS